MRAVQAFKVEASEILKSQEIESLKFKIFSVFPGKNTKKYPKSTQQFCFSPSLLKAQLFQRNPFFLQMEESITSLVSNELRSPSWILLLSTSLSPITVHIYFISYPSWNSWSFSNISKQIDISYMSTMTDW